MQSAPDRLREIWSKSCFQTICKVKYCIIWSLESTTKHFQETKWLQGDCLLSYCPFFFYTSIAWTVKKNHGTVGSFQVLKSLCPANKNMPSPSFVVKSHKRNIYLLSSFLQRQNKENSRKKKRRDQEIVNLPACIGWNFTVTK